MCHSFHSKLRGGLAYVALVVTLNCAIPTKQYGAQAELAWDPSPSPEVAGYKIYFGVREGVYSYQRDVGNVTSASVKDLPPGQTFHFVVRAYDSERLESEPSNDVDTTVVNEPPSVEFTTPSSDVPLSSGKPVQIAATATDPDGSIARVEFYEGANKIGEATAAPYSITWTPGGVANVRLNAVAIDNDGGRSATKTLTLRQAPPAPGFKRSAYSGRIAAIDGDPFKSGIFTLNLNPTGEFTAQFRFAGVKQPAKGTFTADGAATIALKAPNAAAAEVTLDATAANETGTMEGTLSLAGQVVANIYAERVDDLTKAKSPLAGVWEIAPQAQEGATAGEQPSGTSGKLKVIIRPNSRAILSGKLPDGSRLTFAGILWRTGQLPIHLGLQKSKSLVDGLVTFQRDPQDGDSTAGTIVVASPGDKGLPPESVGYDLAGSPKP
jgi:hypothetical protein